MRQKYRNSKAVFDGIEFDSKGEARRYSELKLMQRAGMIHNLERQTRFDLVVNGKCVCRYIADFVYFEGGNKIVEDFKSPATAKERAYRIKVKLLRALFPEVIFRETINKTGFLLPKTSRL